MWAKFKQVIGGLKVEKPNKTQHENKAGELLDNAEQTLQNLTWKLEKTWTQFAVKIPFYMEHRKIKIMRPLNSLKSTVTLSDFSDLLHLYIILFQGVSMPLNVSNKVIYFYHVYTITHV